jgi:hypothetical protein
MCAVLNSTVTVRHAGSQCCAYSRWRWRVWLLLQHVCSVWRICIQNIMETNVLQRASMMRMTGIVSEHVT